LETELPEDAPIGGWLASSIHWEFFDLDLFRYLAVIAPYMYSAYFGANYRRHGIYGIESGKSGGYYER
jgi:hypothetical protein